MRLQADVAFISTYRKEAVAVYYSRAAGSPCEQNLRPQARSVLLEAIYDFEQANNKLCRRLQMESSFSMMCSDGDVEGVSLKWIPYTAMIM